MPKSSLTVEDLASICHEANRAYCEALGDTSQKPWSEADDSLKASSIAGVQFRLDNPEAPVSAQHDQWSSHKLADGWTYGPVKDAQLKTHPCLVSFMDLPAEQRAKDYLFAQVVSALRGLVQKPAAPGAV